jgi:WD40 repeat protein
LVVGWTYWIDVSQSNGNLLVSGGDDTIIKIFDKRESKIVKTFEGVHSRKELHSIFVVIRY